MSLALPSYFSYNKWPVKLVAGEAGGVVAWRVSAGTGAWKSVNHLVTEILFDVGGDVYELSVDQFVQLVEARRSRHLAGEGPVYALYATMNAVEEVAEEEGRRLTREEQSMLTRLRARTYVMFEEELRRKGDPAADPSLAANA